ncbi:arginyl-tRNA-- transferase 2 isoform X1 [Olea europaea subsp. europaea]|nr:arginyl-tRNA-- transferase 2 isoform X1 [Olea europaea subsp. europaea]
MEKTCCPSYTIRLKASDFIPSKEQLRVSKRMQRFLDGQLDAKRSDKLLDEPNSCEGSCSNAKNLSASSSAKESLEADFEGKDKANQFMHYASQQIDNIVQSCVKHWELFGDIQLPKASVKKVAPAKRKLLAEESEDLVYSCNIAFQIAATVRRSKTDAEQMKSLEQGVGENRHPTELSPKLIAELLASQLKEPAKLSGLLIRACNGHINFYSTTEQAHSVKGGNAKKPTQSFTASGGNRCLKKTSGQPNGQKRMFEICLKRSSFDYEEYSLYRKYQLSVHNDTEDHVSEDSYRRFLVDTPLVYVPPNSYGAVPPSGFGSFHQQYVVDGKLIAVGVIDILPKCVSSKYLFWDPDFAFLSLGKFSALEEIRWVRENQVHCPNLQYYYLGYYIHSCSKMRYKAAYQPSELLCPLRYQWVPYDVAKVLLDRRKYVVLSDFDPSQNGDSSSAQPRNITDNYMEMEEQHDDPFQEGSNDIYFNNDEEMTELDSEDSDNESDSESSDPTTVESEDVDASNILIGLKGAHLKYKDLQQAFDPSHRKFIETQLHRYQIVVGKELSERMAYSLG